MQDQTRVLQCPRCQESYIYNLIRVKCPYCDKTMTLSLPEYEFHDGTIGCEHCHRKSHLRIGGYYSVGYATTLDTTVPLWRDSRLLASGGRLLSIKPVVPPELVVGGSDKIPDEPCQDLESAVKCLGMGELRAAAMLCRRCVQTALKIKGIPEGTPSTMINIARQRGILSELAKKQSDAVTFMGGKAAHPVDDPLLNLVESDIWQGLQMVRRILLELFDPDQLSVI